MDEVAPTASGNLPEYSVTELSGAVRRTLEGAFERVRVRGELTEVRRHGSGHVYVSLKDEGGKICGVIWRSTAARMTLKPENGLEVVATGRVTAYADRSTYQLIIERLEYAGAGALLARIEALRLRLAAEGLFDAARKRALPVLPELIGVVTSLGGAVLHDIRITVERRFARPLLVWPVAVQGEGAAAKIAAAIEGFGRLPAQGAVRRPDVLIVARGGGSLEDLMAFNDEAVVRAAASCPIPLISAVGHETDTTLIDFAADRRAPTPTAAAELAVPVRMELLAALLQTKARLAASAGFRVNKGRLALSQAERRLPDLPRLTELSRQRLDERGARLERALPGGVGRARQGLAVAAAALGAGLRHAVARRQTEAARVLPRLSAAVLRARLREAAGRLGAQAGVLEAVSYQAVLGRGYALVSDARGRTLTRAAQVPAGRLVLRFADGVVGVRRETAAAQGRLELGGDG